MFLSLLWALVCCNAGNQWPTYEECQGFYGKRQYIHQKRMKLPPLLLTFPGSGTTMTQLLVEYATGIFTGSIYDEDELYSIMPGLNFCGQRLGLIKAHTKDMRFTVNKSGKEFSVSFDHHKYVRKCHRGMIYGFERFIFVLRDPWAAIWSNYQRDFNFMKSYATVDEKDMKSHTSGIPKAEFNKTAWREKLEFSPHYGIYAYNLMWNYYYSFIFRKYGFSVDMNGLDPTQKPGWRLYDKVAGKAAGGIQVGVLPNVLVVRYEDLISKNEKAKIKALRSIVDFIGLPLDNSLLDALTLSESFLKVAAEKKYVLPDQHSSEKEAMRRLKCAFVLANDPAIHRGGNSSSVSGTPSSSVSSGTKGAPGMVTKAEAYDDPDWVCRMWDLMTANSSSEMKYYGYYHGPLSDKEPDCPKKKKVSLLAGALD
jgi:hypothetical protein